MNEKQTDYKCNCGAPKDPQASHQIRPKRAGESVRIEHDDPPDRPVMFYLKELHSAVSDAEVRLAELRDRLVWVRRETPEQSDDPMDLPFEVAPALTCELSNLLAGEVTRIQIISRTIEAITNDLGV
jgi:hypothetical protein